MVDQFGRWYPDFPGQQPYQDPAYNRAMAQYGQGTAQPQGQGTAYSLPTRHADIIQVDSIEAIDRIPQNAGTTAMYMTKDDQYIVIRDALANGEHADVIYDRRPPAPPAPTINPTDYVLRADLPALIADTLRAMAKEEKNGTV